MSTLVLVSSSLHTLVHKAETLLTQAESACTTLHTAQPFERTCTSLVRLDQALLDAHDLIHREYEHLSTVHGNAVASAGDQAARFQFWAICNNIEQRITSPLEKLAQQFLDHQAHHRHEHGPRIHHRHCHWCRYYYHYHRHHEHHEHHHGGHGGSGSSSLRWAGVGFVVAKGRREEGAGGHDHYLSEYEAKFQEMSVEWSGIKGAVASCFDELEGRLKKGGEKGEDGGKDAETGGGGEGRKQGKSVAEAAHKMIEATNVVDEEIRLIANVEDKIHAMAGILPRSNQRLSSVSSSSSLSMSCMSV
ncbi:hypothetical protein QBC34DRAFT_76617 [Podospora aff. communis PSN243]|uniref:Fungal N-terminal domain-containing protein n=1 Tax=Podospora aff. communis PSN243 TaxID=3040156 RepID=A0AAV9GVJ5_9PEZI|nr:hypothetical protein QBC34DRAFT_76617 [Podospora aff. communis PSN243]